MGNFDSARFQHELLLKEQRSAADACHLEINRDFHPIGNSGEGNAAIHPELFAVERHCPLDLSLAFSLNIIGECKCLLFRNAAYRKRSRDIKRVRTCLYNLAGMKRDIRIHLYVEEIFALQLVILEATPRIYAVRLDLDIKNTCRNIRRSKFQRCIPLVESPSQRK